MNKISLKDKKVIVFDLDGTVVNLTANWNILKDILAEKYKGIYKEQCNVKRVSQCLAKIVQKNDENVLESFFEVIRNYEIENIRDTTLIEETIFFINNKQLFGINKQVRFAVLSLNTRNTIIKALELATIRDKIDLIIGREDVRRWKPSPDGLIRIQQYFKVNKEDMVYFGDLENDLLTGENAGIAAYLIGDLINLVKSKCQQ